MKLGSKLWFVAGALGGVGLVYLGRRWWNQAARGGPRRALGRSLPNGVDDVPRALFQSTGLEFLPGNKVSWCNDKRLFEAVFEAVEAAQHSIHVDVFIFKPGQAGQALTTHLCHKARSGVAVRVLVDPLGSVGFEKSLEGELRAAGCEVRYFRPPRRKPLKFWGRNHRKLIVIDGKVAFTGGFGIADEWSNGGTNTPRAWRESNVRTEGPVVRQMQQAFAAHWMEVGGALLPEEEFRRATPVGNAKACFVTSMDVKGLSNARWVTHIAISAAKRQLWIANAYFVPPPDLLTSLCERTGDGVDLRLLLPGPHTDHLYVRVLQQSTYSRLLGCGARIFEFQPTMIHAKTMLVDDRLVVVGSTNLDPLSQHVLEEGSLLVDDREVAAALKARWEVDLTESVEIVPVEPPAMLPKGAATAVKLLLPPVNTAVP